jgi:hypothetical protein
VLTALGWRRRFEVYSAAAREEIATIFPEIAKRDHAPKPARYILDGKKQKRLIERHLKTNKYLLHEQNTSI